MRPGVFTQLPQRRGVCRGGSRSCRCRVWVGCCTALRCCPVGIRTRGEVAWVAAGARFALGRPTPVFQGAEPLLGFFPFLLGCLACPLLPFSRQLRIRNGLEGQVRASARVEFSSTPVPQKDGGLAAVAFAVFNLGLGAGSPHQLLGLGLFLLLFGHNVVDRGATMVGAATAVMRRQPATVVAAGAPVVGRWGHPMPASPASAVQRKLRRERHGYGGARGGRF